MFVLDSSFFNSSELIIRNVELVEMNYISSQNGFFYINQFKKVDISNITLSSFQNFQSYKGTLFSIQNSKEINILNLSVTIHPTCLFKSQFGGLIFLNRSDKISINNLQFNSLNLFKDEVQHTGQQGGIIYAYLTYMYAFNMQNIQAYGPFRSSADGAFAYINIAEQIIIKNAIITQFTSQKNGGALFTNSEMCLSNVKLIGNRSFFSGGAIHGSSVIQADNVLIEKNESLFGGGIYLINNFTPIQNITFKDNVGLIRGNDFSYYIDEVQIIQFSEFNSHLIPPYYIKNYTFNQTQKAIYQTDYVFNGFTYFLTMKFRMFGESEWIENIDNNYIVQNRYNDLTPVINFAEDYNISYPSIKQNISLNTTQFFYSFQVQQRDSQSEFLSLINIFNNTQMSFLYFTIFSNITDNCLDGMIQSRSSLLPSCSYCVDSFIQNTQSDKPQTKCLPCSKDYFDLCQADFSSLRKGYWRQNLTTDSSLIHTCSINQFNCIGGNFTGKNKYFLNYYKQSLNYLQV
ncbi:hypothetical protein TTHERM_00227690 (macronuclear) [Tetrahymena thermophila SB210]|uniref:Uncharacterized protein n=1 Tax=Tetrahymena thermophila (strain SB210) TaxID=312017 RepID=Q23BR3_TETTS|nr:hypothetical protein TTHERM_00227690 [Tetrahymena thermophila SB210]EAR94055.2 hypothetical protein TTHERM_00227690 [Tetrahymena thermophila SB210]|eukprot:XP_001014300.2 hypothetical protein TTHERM_00227690 [Tetrahymena thermophila SB210]